MKLGMDVNAVGTLTMEIMVFGALGWVFNNVEEYNKDSYECPRYCEVDHKHIILDLQSDFDEFIVENAKSSKNIELASK